MKKPVFDILNFCNQFLKVLRMGAPTFCCAIYLLLCWKIILPTVQLHLILVSFNEWSLVPLLFLSSANISWISDINFPWDILNTSVISCLFRLSSNDHKFKHLNLASYPSPFILLINFVNLHWTCDTCLCKGDRSRNAICPIVDPGRAMSSCLTTGVRPTISLTRKAASQIWISNGSASVVRPEYPCR